MLTRWWKSKKEELKEKKGPLQSIRLLPLEWGKASAFAESTWVLFAGMKSCPQGMDFRLMVQGLSLSPSFSTISTTTSLHVFQVWAKIQPVRAWVSASASTTTIGELTTRTKNKDKHYPLSPESCRVPWTENNNWRTYIRMYVWWLGVYWESNLSIYLTT